MALVAAIQFTYDPMEETQVLLLWRKAAEHANLRQHHFVMLITCIVVQVSTLYHSLFGTPQEKIPYHTSTLTGQAWVLELMTGHPDRIWHNLGVNLEVFEELLQVLQENGFARSRNGVAVEEQLAIFLYTCVTGLSTRHVGERFQQSPDTIIR
jgi:hypothetical protein